MLNQLALGNMKNYKFNPFDKVLARHNDNDTWTPTLYGYTLMKNNEIRYICGNAFSFAQCIPYNKNTAQLIGTNKPYEEPEPKVWRVVKISGSFDKTYTNEELLNFIKTTVINNKDITNFHVMYIPQ